MLLEKRFTHFPLLVRMALRIERFCYWIFPEAVYERVYGVYKAITDRSFSRFLAQYSDRFANTQVLDVGGHWGILTYRMVKSIPESSRVTVFEADARNYLKLVRRLLPTLSSDRVNCVHFAVGRTEGIVGFATNPSSFDCHVAAGGKERVPTSLVRQTSLDSWFLKHNRPAISLIKIDVQGYEIEVLRGMGEVLRSNPDCLVYLELCPSAQADYGVEVKDFFEALSVLNLKYFYSIHKSGESVSVSPYSVQKKAQRQGWVNFIVTTREISRELEAS